MRRTVAWAATVIAAAALLAPASALASFHLIQVREVYAGAADDSYVELQMYSSGENFLSGQSVSVFAANGTLIHESTFTSSVPGSQNQSTVLVGDTGVQASFGVVPDLVDAAFAVPAAGGAVCWISVDCVSWGNFSGSLPSPPGSPAAPGGIPAGMALRRTIARGCATALDPVDDTNDSAADFALVAPPLAPRPNSVPPSEQLCPSSGGGGGGAGGGSGGGPPQTTLRGKPAKRTHDRTPTFRFAADERNVRFQCKLDRKGFRACRSPFTTKRLELGAHRFQVRAVDSDGKVDPTPVTFRFKVVR
jgi:hypothetical protein